MSEVKLNIELANQVQSKKTIQANLIILGIECLPTIQRILEIKTDDNQMEQEQGYMEGYY